MPAAASGAPVASEASSAPVSAEASNEISEHASEQPETPEQRQWSRVRTEAARSVDDLLRAPIAISVVESEEFRRARPSGDLSEALELVPGVFAQTSGNFAQDTRVSIRGFGARATFGIRGIRVLVDGVPTTLPDGQSEVDSVDLAFAERVDVVRGVTSSIYGGAGGGLIAIDTLRPTEARRVRLRTSFGTDHTWNHLASVTGTAGRTGYAIGLSHTRTSGFRDHSRARQTGLLAKLEHELDSGAQLRLSIGAVWAPEAQDPGGLNARERGQDRSGAAPAARSFDAGEKLDQQRVAIQYRRPLGPGTDIEWRAFRIWRDFSNALPLNRRVDFDRAVTGGGLTFRARRGSLRLLAGADVDVQQDRRRNYTNPAGRRGALILRQAEDVRTFGPFVQLEWFASDRLRAVIGARYDWTEFEVGDRFVADGVQSDSIRFRELSPRVAVQYEFSQAAILRVSASTGFQVPTTTELRPADAIGGFDGGRDAERAVTYEIGMKGALGSSLFYDVALFDIRVRDVLVPFQDASEETFFQNAGRVRRRGAELALSCNLTPYLSLRGAYTYADYRYADFDPDNLVDLDGNREPNVPMHVASLELRYDRPNSFFATLAIRHTSDIELDDANQNETDGAITTDLRVGMHLRRRELEIDPFVGVRNLFGVEFDGTVRPNAAVGRFFEPAPESHVYVGAELRF